MPGASLGARALLHQGSGVSLAGATTAMALPDDAAVTPAKRLGIADDMERVAVKLTHSFPWVPAGQVRSLRC